MCNERMFLTTSRIIRFRFLRVNPVLLLIVLAPIVSGIAATAAIPVVQLRLGGAIAMPVCIGLIDGIVRGIGVAVDIHVQQGGVPG